MNDRYGKPTVFNGIEYRSATEARWAVFFNCLGVDFQYEPKAFSLSTGVGYLPDFYVEDFNAFFEVKPSDDKIVTEEAFKARQLSLDHPGMNVWLAIGAPSAATRNILVLNSPKGIVQDMNGSELSTEDLLSDEKYRFQFLEDRRDEGVYWLHSDDYLDFMIGGPGTPTEHFRDPMLIRQVELAYQEARNVKFD